MDIFIPGLKHVSGYVPAFPRVFSVYIMWICKCSSFAFLLLCRKSHKIPLWISLWHMCIMQEWESCINNRIKNTTRIIQLNPSAITAVICGGLPSPSVDHPESLLNTQTMLGSITGAAMTQTRDTQAGNDTHAKITPPWDTWETTGKRNLHKEPC